MGTRNSSGGDTAIYRGVGGVRRHGGRRGLRGERLRREERGKSRGGCRDSWMPRSRSGRRRQPPLTSRAAEPPPACRARTAYRHTCVCHAGLARRPARSPAYASSSLKCVQRPVEHTSRTFETHRLRGARGRQVTLDRASHRRHAMKYIFAFYDSALYLMHVPASCMHVARAKLTLAVHHSEPMGIVLYKWV